MTLSASFLQLSNLHVVVLGHCSLVVVMMFQDKFAHLQQLNSPYSRDYVHQVSNMLYQ